MNLTLGEMLPPDFSDLEKANEEILRLRIQLIKTNRVVAKRVLKRHLDKLAADGQVRALTEELRKAQGTVVEYNKVLDQLIQHFESHRLFWWDATSLLRELHSLKLNDRFAKGTGKHKSKPQHRGAK